jgi:hypothetical protein
MREASMRDATGAAIAAPRAFTSVPALLAAVEALPPRAAGAFVIAAADGDQLGAVLVDANRVCCAAVAGRGHTLRDLLSGSLDEDTASGLLRRALERHTVESLIHLDGCAGVATWTPHRADSYHPRCSFGTVELLAAVNVALYPTEADGAAELDAWLPIGTAGATFVVGDDDEPVVVRERDGDRIGLAGAAELGAWATSALDITRGFSPAAMGRALAAATGRAALAWRPRRRLVHAAVFEDTAALARTVAELERRGLPAVLSARPPQLLDARPDLPAERAPNH